MLFRPDGAQIPTTAHFDPELLDIFPGIVEPLHQRFIQHEQYARNELAEIIPQYFCDIFDLFEENL
ncbi:MAG: hypothetical protein Q7U57_12770 [Methylovulum sp.]|nr:hypothetical protein [Methylovulum sp.]